MPVLRLLRRVFLPEEGAEKHLFAGQLGGFWRNMALLELGKSLLETTDQGGHDNFLTLPFLKVGQATHQSVLKPDYARDTDLLFKGQPVLANPGTVMPRYASHCLES